MLKHCLPGNLCIRAPPGILQCRQLLLSCLHGCVTVLYFCLHILVNPFVSHITGQLSPLPDTTLGPPWGPLFLPSLRAMLVVFGQLSHGQLKVLAGVALQRHPKASELQPWTPIMHWDSFGALWKSLLPILN